MSEQIQPGPCIVCEATNYPLSFGGPDLCPACDCGMYINPKKVREIREAHNKAIARIRFLELRLEALQSSAAAQPRSEEK